MTFDHLMKFVTSAAVGRRLLFWILVLPTVTYGHLRDERGAKTNNGSLSDRPCFDLSAWKNNFTGTKQWRVFSQGNQDSVLDALFSDQSLGTSSKFFVEFGFNTPTWSAEKKAGSGPNTQYLRFRKGWSGLLLDGNNEDLKINLHKEFLTELNMNDIFHKYKVPEDVDYVSVDIDSCDLYMFRALVANTTFKPKVITVEYNSNYQCSESKTNACKRGNESYSFHGDNIYGASLLALSRVADENGYSLAWVESRLDAVFVKRSLLCPDSSVPYKEFCAATGLPNHGPASAADRQKWVVEYPGSLVP